MPGAKEKPVEEMTPRELLRAARPILAKLRKQFAKAGLASVTTKEMREALRRVN